MRQILARVDDELHAQLKRRAASQGRSLNDLVVGALRRELELSAQTPRERALARAEALGMLTHPGGWVPPERVLSHEEIAQKYGGASAAVLEGLEWARGPKP